MKTPGFTLIEILVVIGIIGIILGFSSVNLLSLRNKSSINSMVVQLVADLKQQQTKAMIGDTEGRLDPDSYGVFLSGSRYTLFHGTYPPTDPGNNFNIDLEADLTLTSNPSTWIVFKKGSGELETGSLTSLTLSNTSSSEHKTISINSFGVITEIN